MNAMISFAVKSLCESELAALVSIETKNQNGLDIKYNMRFTLSKPLHDFIFLFKANISTTHWNEVDNERVEAVVDVENMV